MKAVQKAPKSSFFQSAVSWTVTLNTDINIITIDWKMWVNKKSLSSENNY